MKERGRRATRMMHHGRYVRPWTLDTVTPHVAPIVASYRAALAMLEIVPQAQEAIRTDKLLSDVGKRTKQRELATAHAAALKTARQAIVNGMAEAERLQGQMVRNGIDKTDVSAAIVRAEIRGWLREMDPAQRMALLSVDLDREIMAAVIEAPAALSGVSQGRLESLRKDATAAANPEQARAIDEIQEGLASLVSAEQAASAALSEASGVTASELDVMMGGQTLSERIAERLRAGGYLQGEDDQTQELEEAA